MKTYIKRFFPDVELLFSPIGIITTATTLILLLGIANKSCSQDIKLIIPYGHDRIIQTMDYSQDGKFVATGSEDNSVILWDTQTWKEIHSIQVNLPVQQVKFLPDSKSILIVSGMSQSGAAGPVRFLIFNILSNRVETEFSFSGDAAAEISANGDIMLIPSFRASAEPVNSGFTAQYNNAYGRDAVALWSISKNKKISLNIGNVNKSGFLRHNNRNILLATIFELNAPNGMVLKALEIEEGNEVNQPGNLRLYKTFNINEEIRQLITSGNGDQFATIGLSNTIRLWSLKQDQPLHDFVLPANKIVKTLFTKDGEKIIVSFIDKGKSFISGFSTRTFERLFFHPLPPVSKEREIVVSPNGKNIIVSNGKSALVFNSGGNKIGELRGYAEPVDSFSFSKNGMFVYTGKKPTPALTDKNRAKIDELNDQLAEILASSLSKIYEIHKIKESSKGELDSIKASMLKSIKTVEKKQDTSSTRIWDLAFARAVKNIGQAIEFGTDTISVSKKLKLTATTRSLGQIDVVRTNMNLISAGMQGMPEVSSKRELSSALGLLNDAMESNKSFLSRLQTPFIHLVNTETHDTLNLIGVDTAGFIILSHEGYFTSSKDVVQKVYYKIDSNIVAFDQLDIKFNRPDIILKKIGLANPALINIYKKAYEKRIERLKIDTSWVLLSNAPQLSVVNKEEIPFYQKQRLLSLRIHCNDAAYPISTLNIWVNDVPEFGLRGFSIEERNLKRFDTTITIELSEGENVINVSAINKAGIESYRTPIFIKYDPATSIDEKVYFIGIGADSFADKKRNLMYCAKDIRDLVLVLKEKFGKKLCVDTLFNEMVTVDNVKALKQRLLQSDIDDKVIIAYSGHGLLSKDYDYYLSTFDVDFSKPEATGLPYEALESLLDGIRSRKKLVLIDACHSGEVDKEYSKKAEETISSIPQGSVAKIGPIIVKSTKVGMENSFELMQELFLDVSRRTGAMIISAASGTQIAREGGSIRNGVFTYSVLEAFRNNKSISVASLKEYVQKNVTMLTNGLQVPTSRGGLQAKDWFIW